MCQGVKYWKSQRYFQSLVRGIIMYKYRWLNIGCFIWSGSKIKRGLRGCRMKYFRWRSDNCWCEILEWCRWNWSSYGLKMVRNWMSCWWNQWYNSCNRDKGCSYKIRNRRNGCSFNWNCYWYRIRNWWLIDL